MTRCDRTSVWGLPLNTVFSLKLFRLICPHACVTISHADKPVHTDAFPAGHSLGRCACSPAADWAESVEIKGLPQIFLEVKMRRSVVELLFFFLDGEASEIARHYPWGNAIIVHPRQTGSCWLVKKLSFFFRTVNAVPSAVQMSFPGMTSATSDPLLRIRKHALNSYFASPFEGSGAASLAKLESKELAKCLVIFCCASKGCDHDQYNHLQRAQPIVMAVKSHTQSSWTLKRAIQDWGIGCERC